MPKGVGYPGMRGSKKSSMAQERSKGQRGMAKKSATAKKASAKKKDR